MNNLLAQIRLYPGTGGLQGIPGSGPLATPGDNGINLFTEIISTAIGLITIIAIIWFIFTFITGAIGIIASGGDKQALESAKKKITTGLIGLVVVIVAIFVFDLIGYLLGFGSGSSGLLNITTLFGLIQIK